MRCDSPLVPEGILQHAGPIAVELVLRRPDRRAAGLDRTREDFVAVLDIEGQRYRRPADSLGRHRAKVGEFVGHHHAASVDRELGMAELAPRHRHAHQLDGPEHVLVVLQRGCAVVDDEVGREGHVALGDVVDCHMYGPLLQS